MTLDELTPWLFARTSGGIRWGLERTRELLAGVDDPHRRFHSVLVGGTNGKGSVAALCAAALGQSGGLKVGLYTSPHLIDFTERVRVDGVPISEAALLAAAERLRPGIESTDATFFEATTAMAFLALADADVDLAVVEVGLGGRLDATNVLEPLAVGVTNVGLDHTDYLGATLAEIAGEKAGIIKTGTTAVVGNLPKDLREVFRLHAAEAGASMWFLDEMTRVTALGGSAGGVSMEVESSRWGRRRLSVGLRGAHQAANAALAMELLGVLPDEVRPSWDAIASGFAEVRWPGRLQVERVRGTTWVFDVAHNADGARALAEALPNMDLPTPRVLVSGILSDKDWRAMLSALLPGSDASILTIASSAPASRLWDPEEAARWAVGALGSSPRVIPSLDAALQRATTLAPHGTIVVTGSVHTVGDAMRSLGLPAI